MPSYLLRAFSLATLVCLLASCEKEVTINLKSGSDKVVVEGSIEIGLPPVVVLTKSMNFFSKIDLTTLEDLFLHDAEVTVSDGVQTVRLKEYSMFMNGHMLYFYSVDSADHQALLFVGKYETPYHLTIRYQNRDYSSSTWIPHGNPLDSLWVEEPNFPSERTENLVQLYAQYTDPDTLGNRARYMVKRNSEPFRSPFFSTFDDALINGNTVPLKLYPGFIFTDDDEDREANFYFAKGDTVVVKWSSINKEVFDFWRTLEFSATATGNPFAAPVEISTNIRGGALGVWAGYGSTYDTLVIAH